MQEKLNEIEIIDSFDTVPTFDWSLSAIGAEHAWKYTKGAGIKIASIDTGIDMHHPDLKYKNGINMLMKSVDVTDESGHGTHVAGLLVGKNTGVAPEADLYVAKVLDGEGRGSLASIMDGFTYAINTGVDVLNVSLGTRQDLPISVRERIVEAYNKGIVVVCATGNAGQKSPFSPARMNEVIGVGGVGYDLNLTNFSNYGHNMNVVAPALDIFSTYIDGKYARMTGTSMASPLVAGGIGLVIAHYRSKGIKLLPKDVKDILTSLPSYNDTNGNQYKLFDLRQLIT